MYLMPFSLCFVFRLLLSLFLLRLLNASARVNVRRRMCVWARKWNRLSRRVGMSRHDVCVYNCICSSVRVGSLSISFSHICHCCRWGRTANAYVMSHRVKLSLSLQHIHTHHKCGHRKKKSFVDGGKKTTKCFEKEKFFTHPNLCLWILITCPIASIYSFKAF